MLKGRGTQFPALYGHPVLSRWSVSQGRLHSFVVAACEEPEIGEREHTCAQVRVQGFLAVSVTNQRWLRLDPGKTSPSITDRRTKSGGFVKLWLLLHSQPGSPPLTPGTASSLGQEGPSTNQKTIFSLPANKRRPLCQPCFLSGGLRGAYLFVFLPLCPLMSFYRIHQCQRSAPPVLPD